LYLTQFLPGKLTFYGWALKSEVGAVLVPKAAAEISSAIFYKSFRVKTNELPETNNKSTNHLAGMVIGCLKPDVAREPPIGPRYSTVKKLSCYCHAGSKGRVDIASTLS
jgi:hypothetical protein